MASELDLDAMTAAATSGDGVRKHDAIVALVARVRELEAEAEALNAWARAATDELRARGIVSHKTALAMLAAAPRGAR